MISTSTKNLRLISSLIDNPEGSLKHYSVELQQIYRDSPTILAGDTRPKQVIINEWMQRLTGDILSCWDNAGHAKKSAATPRPAQYSTPRRTMSRTEQRVRARACTEGISNAEARRKIAHEENLRGPKPIPIWTKFARGQPPMTKPPKSVQTVSIQV